MDFRSIRLCKGEGYSVVPQEIVDLDLTGSVEALRSAGFNVLRSDILLVAERGGLKCTIYRNGRMLIEPATEKAAVKKVAEELYGLLRPL
jgi:hypothetical protein